MEAKRSELLRLGFKPLMAISPENMPPYMGLLGTNFSLLMSHVQGEKYITHKAVDALGKSYYGIDLESGLFEYPEDMGQLIKLLENPSEGAKTKNRHSGELSIEELYEDARRYMQQR